MSGIHILVEVQFERRILQTALRPDGRCGGRELNACSPEIEIRFSGIAKALTAPQALPRRGTKTDRHQHTDSKP